MDEAKKAEIAERNRDKSRRQDNKQHCEKILLGIRNFDNNSAHRAIWELVQNARDLSENCHIRIELDDEKLVFAHNGLPFTYDSLSSLVKQVSSEEKENPDAAGQFGTGFMTTHKFSRKVFISGSYKVDEDENEYVALNGENEIVLDRTDNDLDEMIAKMSKTLGVVDNLINKPTTSEKAEWTEFRYMFDDDDNKSAARHGVESAMGVMPYVMTINDRLQECTITIDGESTTYKKIPRDDVNGLKHTTILVDDEPFECYFLQSEDGRDVVILPLSSENRAKSINGIARWFIYFPLLGTENIGINYIFHSERFYPEEPRDCIVLPKSNKEVMDRYNQNKNVLAEMTNMLFAYLRKYVGEIDGAKLLAPVKYDAERWKDDVTCDYFKERQKIWAEEFANLPFIQIDGERLCANDIGRVKFLDNTIVEFLSDPEHAEYLDTVYAYASKVSVLPAKEDVLEWSKIVYDWNPEDNIRFVTVKNIVDKITEEKDTEGLLDFLMYLKESGQTEYFREKIIPNREGTLCAIGDLRCGHNFPKNLYEVAKPLVPDFTCKLVDDNYVKIQEDWVLPTRDDLKTALGAFVNSEKVKAEPLKGKLIDVLNFCMTFPTENTGNTRYQAMSVICGMHDTPLDVNFVPHLGDVDKEQQMYNVVFDFLVEWEFKQIENTAQTDENWYGENGEILYNLLNALSNKERPTSYQKMMQEYAIFPNRKGALRKWDELHVLSERDTLKSEDISDLCDYYEKVMDVDIREKWVDDKFVDFEKFTEDKAKDNMARPIDDELQSSNYSSEVTLEIIKHLDNNEPVWADWFGNINKNKAEIFLHRIDTSDLPDVYTILRNKSKIKKLAELSANPRMEEIIEAGKAIIEQRDYDECHNAFLRELGDFVEQLLLEKLQGEINDGELKVEVSDEQGGQDYLVRLKGKVMYHVEVKSRWSTRDSVEMSPLQFKTSVKEKDNYSLCVVDMTWKGVENIGDRKYDDLETCVKHTKVLHDIGERNEWCVESVEDLKDRTHIGGSYSLVVPQNLLKPDTTPDFDSLVERIRSIIVNKLR